MKIYPLSPVAFDGNLRVDSNCKFAEHPAIKRFGEYIKTSTSPDLDVFIKDMPGREAGIVSVTKYTPAYKEQRDRDKVNAQWLKDGGSAADIPGGHPSPGSGPTSYTASVRENLHIIYKSPCTWAVSGFYLDTKGDSDNDAIYGYLVQNAKTNATCDIT